MIVLLTLLIATMIAGIIGSRSRDPAIYEGLGELSRWGIRLFGKAIAVIVLMQAAWLGLRLMELLK